MVLEDLYPENAIVPKLEIQEKLTKMDENTPDNYLCLQI